MTVTKGIFVGLSTIDIVYDVDDFPVLDTKITAKSQSVFAGGPATNAAVTFRHMGGEAVLVTGVGRHPIGGLIREEMSQYSVKLLDLSPEFAEVPVISAVAVNAAGQRNVISANATRIKVSSVHVEPSILASASVVLVDGHYMQACQAWAEAARRSGIRVALDGGSWKQGLEELLRHVDTAICSGDFRPPGCSDREQVIEFLESRGVAEIAVTAGSGPIRFTAGRDSGLIPVPHVQVVDTMGAGDILHGAYCWYRAQGFSFSEALGKAAVIASESCRFSGTRAWMLSDRKPS
ncbi:MAG: hypothetical protein JOZ33_04855 [Acidobacteriaceae bacterium]|nr:hypothetical protein [Acidobacteriaceae bacterium]